ncbi:MAG: hypothetical protein E6Z15_22785, partial [Paenibacillus macerans]|nr:hypothetical protein [Paenibacillus macerans]
FKLTIFFTRRPISFWYQFGNSFDLKFSVGKLKGKKGVIPAISAALREIEAIYVVILPGR